MAPRRRRLECSQDVHTSPALSNVPLRDCRTQLKFLLAELESIIFRLGSPE